MPSFETPALAWIALAIVAGVVEISLPIFGVIFVSLAAVASAAAAYLGFGLAAQIVTFAVVLTASLAVLRPWVVARIGTAPGVPTRTEPLIGRDGIVTETIESTVGSGRVNVRGEDWAARSAAPLPLGTRVRVVGADGIVLEVTRA